MSVVAIGLNNLDG